MTENVVRERVISLYHIVTGEVEGPKSVSFVSNEPGSEGDVLPSFLHEHKISISSWDIEANLTGSPVTPVPFIQQPYLLPHDSLPLIELLFPDYNQSIRRSWAERYGLVVADKADWSDELCHFFGELALATRVGRGLHSSLPDLYKVRHISHPHPFALSHGSYGSFPNFEDVWKIDLCLEPDRRIKSALPHIMLTASQPAQAREGSILYGELAVIVSVMHDRAIQPEVGSEEEMKKLSRMDLEELDEVVGEKAPAFPNEQKFPLLLLSLVNPRHARILCAYMSDDLLVVEMSKIYSFEEKESAPIGLFLSWLFASPSPVVET
ncbi:uncharacterized protein BO88DRAFT_445403 [Aspergillus vadensis CBS 113365]|uniref:Uncharacterized protein n=1 Tax=Aspergillus vadensis (strain CBS 113365 / IMI 142717 / IBT 24658) TaxID=1448311 RepID=A0A319B834_ASPVC|nr:hypothetical protein BO88DRAFT_445403 [Aspergillus vadensis CBS 113365]PYH66540.1 hypothetical protein BO88DRAFT_445403 [Aspergillus vadensis CBS 113365]